jgi:predicted CXXCH cytochrome family protein
MKRNDAQGQKGGKPKGRASRKASEKTRWALLAVLALSLAAVSYWQWMVGHREQAAKSSRVEQTVQVAEPPIPVLRDSKYLNTRPQVQYMGSERCGECHSDQQNSYLQTAHAHSFSLVDPPREPADGAFDHQKSRRRLRAYRANGRLRHSESLLLADGTELPLQDRPLKYLIGSGRFARTYLAEIDGCLVESPLSWYSSLQAWRMSPGYDLPQHSSFRRDIDADCLYCHVGRAENVPGSVSRLMIREYAIGCERCHGPGSAHMSLHEHGGNSAGGTDLTIVNPGQLPRELAEAICHQCHLESVASAVVRGRKREEFRPGLAWTAFVVNYSYQRQQGNMTVTGHVEQLHASRCYQASESLTCTTCHDPHHVPKTNERREQYRTACLKCHEEAACRASPTLRTQENQDDCSACHMPRSAVEIPHLAFTHHRIAVHRATPVEGTEAVTAATALVPILDISGLPEIDGQYLLGLAYWRHHAESDDAHLPSARQRAQELLGRVARSGLRGGAVATPLAALALEEGDVPQAKVEAERALADQALTPRDRVLASELLAALYVQENRLTEATRLLNQLIELRPHPKYWFLLGVCRQSQGDLAGAIQAMEHVVAIESAEPATYRALATLYQLRGNVESAQRNFARAELIEANLPK